MAICAYPYTHHNIILEDLKAELLNIPVGYTYPNILSKGLQRSVKKLHQLSITQVERNIADVELSLCLVMIRQTLSRVELFVVFQNLLGRHLWLHLFRGLVREIREPSSRLRSPCGSLNCSHIW